MILGAHISVSGGVEKSPRRASEMGFEALQIFSKNQKRWRAEPIPEKQQTLFRKNMNAFGIVSSAVHDSYLINLATADRDMRRKSMEAFLDEAERADALNIPFLIFHPGSHVGAGEATGIDLAGKAIGITLEAVSDLQVSLLVETTAGQGTSLGYRFEQIRDMIGAAGGDSRIGVCYDTAHTFAAGYDIRDEVSFRRTFEEFDSVIGLDRLKAFHLNDSKKECGSHVDRHEHIGGGYIGKKAFGFLLNDPRFSEIPAFLETPEGEKYYKRNLQALRSCVENSQAG